MEMVPTIMDFPASPVAAVAAVEVSTTLDTTATGGALRSTMQTAHGAGTLVTIVRTLAGTTAAVRILVSVFVVYGIRLFVYLTILPSEALAEDGLIYLEYGADLSREIR
jgi:hypothetical protein